MQIPGFELGSEIGRGAMSVVYRAMREGQVFAVKVTLPSPTSNTADDGLRFRREAAALARMRHPGVVRVVEVGELQTTPYLVMEFVDGQSLEALLRQGPLTQARTIELAITLAGALAEVHRRGLVHRDVKPANILVDSRGNAKIIDFGLALGAAVSDENDVAGSFLYAAPEQTGLRNHVIDGRADLYGLGAVLFECLAGRPPFIAENASELLRLHASEPAPNVRKFRADIGPVLAAIIAKLLEKDPAARYPSAATLSADLERLEQLEAQHQNGTPPPLGKSLGSFIHASDVHLVGREAEVERLEALWAQARGGKGAFVVVDGEPGSGKTRLLRELLARVQTAKLPVLIGKCQQSDSLPFGPLREAIDRWAGQLLRLPEEEHATRARFIQALEELTPLVARFCRGWRQVVGTEENASAETVEKERIYDAMAEVFAEVGKVAGGVLVVVDDLQWADDGTIQVLKRLSTRLNTTPVLLAGTCRNDSESQPLTEAVVAQLSSATPTRITLRPLDVAAVGRLASLQLDGGLLEPAAVEKIASLANGNPFAVGEYLRALLDRGVLGPTATGWKMHPGALAQLSLPNDVLSLVTVRAQSLSPSTGELLQTAAAIGLRFDEHFLVRVSGISETAVAQALAEASAASLVETTQDARLTFVHDRVREALLARLSPSSRRDLHQKIAEQLDQVIDLGLEDTFALANHYFRGHPERRPERVFAANYRAGTAAIESHAHKDAIDYLARSIQAANTCARPPSELGAAISALGRAYAWVGRAQDALAHFADALGLTTDPTARARIRIERARAQMQSADFLEALSEIGQGLTELGERPPKSAAWRALSTVWFVALSALLIRFRWGYGSARGPLANRLRVIAALYNAGIDASIFLMRSDLLISFLGKSLYVSHFIGDSRQSAESLLNYGTILAQVGLRKSALAVTRMGTEVAERLGERGLIATAKRVLGTTLLFAGDSRAAETADRAAQSTVLRWGDGLNLMIYCVDLGSNLLSRGKAREGLEVFELALAREELASGASKGGAALHFGAAHALSMLGRREAAEASEQKARVLSEGSKDRAMLAYLYAAQAAIAHERGEFDRVLTEIVPRFEALKIPASALVFHAQPILVFEMYARLHKLAEGDTAHSRALRAALVRAKTIRVPALRVHRLIGQAWLERLSGKPKRALRLLDESDTLAAAADSPWARFEILNERARLATGFPDERFAHAKAAESIAVAQGWERAAASVRLEFALPDDAGAATPLVGSRSAQKHLRALLQVSLASASTLDPVDQARAALDEIVRLLGADRAYLFAIQPDSSIRLLAGRDGKSDLPEAVQYSSTVVKRVAQEREPLVVTGTDEGALIGSHSAVAHSLRSIMAAPLLLRDQLLGVIYLDSRATKGLFTKDDVQILRGISNHVAIAMEMARTARAEAHRIELQKEMELTATVQSFYLPRDFVLRGPATESAGFYRPAAICSGDWWWHEIVDGRSMRVMVGDVTGHGVGPAMVTASVATQYLSSVRKRSAKHERSADSMKSLLGDIHQDLAAIYQGKYQMTVGALTLGADGQMTWLSAGSPPAMILRADGKVALLQARGGPLGAEALTLGEERIALAPNERVLVYSDGLLDAPMQDGRPLGRRKLAAALAGTRGLRLEEAAHVLAELIENKISEPQDDITFVLAGRKP